ncbi:hypothetical protein PFISCL1PPCAC_21621, partial [Pristionchus fissidentatus]
FSINGVVPRAHTGNGRIYADLLVVTRQQKGTPRRRIRRTADLLFISSYATARSAVAGFGDWRTRDGEGDEQCGCVLEFTPSHLVGHDQSTRRPLFPARLLHAHRAPQDSRPDSLPRWS